MTGPRVEPGRPTITVITIFHDEERFLAEAIDSVLAQRGADWELLLVDDGSTDASPSIARRYAGRYPDRIRHLQHPGGGNRGMSASRNLGIAEARGHWLTFLDGDDVWLPGKLTTQLALLEGRSDVEVLASPAQWWRSWAGTDAVDGDWVQSLGPGGADPTVVDPPSLLLDFLDDEWRSICDLVISRRAAELVGGYEPEFRGMYEDQVFHAKVLATSPALVTSTWWYRYRQHAEACTTASHRAGAHRPARLRYLRWLRGRLRSTGDGQPELQRVVRSHLRRARYPRVVRVVDRFSASSVGS